MRRYECNAQSCDDGLLDCLVAAHLHPDAGRNARARKQALHEKARSGARFAHEKGLLRKRRSLHAALAGMHVIGARNDDMRMLPERGLLHRHLSRRPSRQGKVEGIRLERGEN